jgi:DNA-binding NtrC family response regulator
MECSIKCVVHPDVDPFGPVKGVLLVDDDPTICNVMGKLISHYIRDIFLVCTDSPPMALELCRDLCFDLAISDIWMDEMMGYELVPLIQKILPSIYTIAMTAIGETDAAFLTGKSNADAFFKKNKGTAVLVEMVKAGLVKSEAKRKAAIPSDFQKVNWRKRGIIREKLGMSMRENEISEKRIHALALMMTGKYRMIDVAFFSGFSSVQMMRGSLNRLAPSLLDACK